MTNNDELALKLKAAAEKAGAEEWKIKRNGPGEYGVMVKGSLVKYSGWSTHRPVTDEVVDKKTADFIATASPANILALLAERDADKKLIAELEARTVSVKLPDSDEYLGKYGDNMSDMTSYENAVYKALAEAGIKLEVGE